MESVFSDVIAGVMRWGTWGHNLTSNQMANQINSCLETGISSFDHADIYGGYTTEETFGKAIEISGVSRNKIQLISKCGILHPGGNRNYKIKAYDYSKNHIIWSVENSLKNLKTDYLDLFLLHRPSPLLEPNEVAEAVFSLKKEGKITAFGVSNFLEAHYTFLKKAVKIEYNQIEFSPFTYKTLFDGSLEKLQQNNIKPMAWSPLGTLFADENLSMRTLLEPIALKYNLSLDQLLITWVMQHPANIIPVVGTANTERLKSYATLKNIKLNNEDWFTVLEICSGKKVA